MHAVRGVAEAIEERTPGATHSVRFSTIGKRCSAEIIMNRNRSSDDAAGAGKEADEAPSPVRGLPTKQAPHKAAAQAKMAKAAAHSGKAAPTGAAADEPMADTDEVPAKEAAATMRKHITDITTDVVTS